MHGAFGYEIDPLPTSPSRSRGQNTSRRAARGGREASGRTGDQDMRVNRIEAVRDDEDSWIQLINDEVYQALIKDFYKPVGCRGNRDLIDVRSVDFVFLFWTDEFWELLTSETNRYAYQFLEKTQLKEKSKFHSWYDITVQETKAFLSLHLSKG